MSGGRGAGRGAGAGEGERVRLFVALELPTAVQDALVSWAASGVAGHSGLRLLPPDHLHVTLCFLGWQPEDAVVQIASACRSAAGGSAGTLSVAEAIWLPARRPRVLAVRLREEDGGVVRMQSRLSEALEAGGWYKPERRAYLPHVTVARVGGRARVRPFDVASPPPLAFPASRVTLFRSRLSPGGARYEGLASVEVG